MSCLASLPAKAGLLLKSENPPRPGATARGRSKAKGLFAWAFGANSDTNGTAASAIVVAQPAKAATTGVPTANLVETAGRPERANTSGATVNAPRADWKTTTGPRIADGASTADWKGQSRAVSHTYGTIPSTGYPRTIALVFAPDAVGIHVQLFRCVKAS